MLKLNRCHHVAIICSNFQKSKQFYTSILGLEVVSEHYRADRESIKLDLALNGTYLIELFSFPNPPQRMSRPEAVGLRHIAFEVDNLDEELLFLSKNNILFEQVRTDEVTNKRFTFIFDPDNLPVELYEK